MGKIKIVKLKLLNGLFERDRSVIWFIALVLGFFNIFAFNSPLVSAQNGGSTIPAGCPGGPDGPIAPGTECPGGSASEKAKNYCNAKHSSNEAKKKACIKGFTAGYNGGNKSNACKSYSGNVKDACTSGFEAGKSAKENEDKPPPEAAAGGGEGQGTEEIQCEASIFSISWIICAAIEFGANFTNWFFNSFLRPLLEEVPVSLNPSEGSFQAWQGFRLLANIMLVASMLAIVYAQARGDQ